MENPRTARLAGFVSGLRYEAIPAEVHERLKLLILDALGCALYGAELQWCRILRSTLSRLDGTRDCSVWGTSARLSAPHAALANGTQVQSFELDDVHRAGVLHVGAVVLPALIAIAELKKNLTGKEFLAAAAAGYEVGPRVGLCMGPEHIGQGWHSGATVGVFAAAAAAAHGLKLAQEKTIHALGCRSLGAVGPPRRCGGVHCAGVTSRMSRLNDAAPLKPLDNLLLAALPAGEYRELAGELEPVELAAGLALYESGGRQGYVYFPTSGIVSLLYVLEDGSSTALAVTGREGVVGISLFMGGETTPSRAVVLVKGRGYRIRAATLKRAFERRGALHELLLRFTQALITQMTQTAVCNRHHGVDQQLCRWLLLILDRVPGDEVAMTQELIAAMLGVRREAVTAAAGKLQTAGAIRYRRGRIAVLERKALERRACECYAVVKRENDRLLAR